MNATAESRLTDALSMQVATGATWLDTRRSDAASLLRERGVPHRRMENWKYTDLKTALGGANDSGESDIRCDLTSIPDGIELFELANLADAPQWVQAHFGKAALSDAMPAASLLLARTGFALLVPRNTAASKPMRFSFEGSGHARALIVLEDGASLDLIETRPAGTGFSNVGMEIIIGANARLTHVRMSEAAADAIQVEDVAVRIARDGSYTARLSNGGASLSRLTLRLTLKEKGAHAELSGVSVLGGKLHADVTTEIYHASGETHSTQLFKHVVGGHGRAVYQGKITVAEGADKSDSRQTTKALLLGQRAEADLKPELEIFADDVKCAHGAAVGDLDADSLFYLRSRGVPESEARNMLIRAFLEEAVAEIADETVRAAVWQSVEDALPRAMAS